MKQIDDFEHNVKHVYDVVYYTKELINSIDVKIDIEVCILSAYCMMSEGFLQPKIMS